MESPKQKGWDPLPGNLTNAIIGGTASGDGPPSAYARSVGIDREAYWRGSARRTPRQFGEHLVAILDDSSTLARRFRPEGRYGNQVLEGEAAERTSSSSPTARQAQLLGAASELRPSFTALRAPDGLSDRWRGCGADTSRDLCRRGGT